MPSLLVTNDFPPKVGGIQSYLYELWRRLPPDQTTVLPTPHTGAAAWGPHPNLPAPRAPPTVLPPSAALALRPPRALRPRSQSSARARPFPARAAQGIRCCDRRGRANVGGTARDCRFGS